MRIHAAILMLAGALACGRAAPTGQRVVGVSKQINEYPYEIGAESVLVARDLTSVYRRRDDHAREQQRPGAQGDIVSRGGAIANEHRNARRLDPSAVITSS